MALGLGQLDQLGNDRPQCLTVRVGAQKGALGEGIAHDTLGGRTPLTLVAVEQAGIGATDDGGEPPAEIGRVL
ncbi:hypothetical protein OG979_13920 [Actinomadura citrea]